MTGNSYPVLFRFGHLMLIACLLNLVMLDSIKATDNQEPGQDEREEQLAAWKRQITAQPRALYLVTLEDGTQYQGKLKLKEDWIEILFTSKEALTNHSRGSKAIPWNQIEDVVMIGSSGGNYKKYQWLIAAAVGYIMFGLVLGKMQNDSG